MNTITHAEEKAFAENDSGVVDNAEVVSAVKAPASSTFFHTQAPAKQLITYPIVYSETRIHEPRQQMLERKRVLSDLSPGPIVEIYKHLRTQVVRKLKANNWSSLAVISARSGQGATLTAVNLGISIARDHRFTTLIADFNLNNPAVHSYFDYEPAESNTLSAYFDGQVCLENLFVNPGIGGLVFIPGGAVIEHSSEMLMSPKAQQLVNEINERYSSRVVIYDLPPILESDDALATLDYFDACLVVVEEGVTKKADLERVSELLGDKPVLGIVYNNAY